MRTSGPMAGASRRAAGAGRRKAAIISSGSTSSTPGEMVMLYQQIRIPESVKAIELTLRMRVSDLKKGKQAWFDARIMMDFKDAEGKKLKGAPAPNTGKSTEGWVERSVKFLVPEGAADARFHADAFPGRERHLRSRRRGAEADRPAPLQGSRRAKAAADKEKQAKQAAASQRRPPRRLREERLADFQRRLRGRQERRRLAR